MLPGIDTIKIPISLVKGHAPGVSQSHRKEFRSHFLWFNGYAVEHFNTHKGVVRRDFVPSHDSRVRVGQQVSRSVIYINTKNAAKEILIYSLAVTIVIIAWPFITQADI